MGGGKPGIAWDIVLQMARITPKSSIGNAIALMVFNGIVVPLIFNVTHQNEYIRFDGRDKCPYNPLKLQKTMFFENPEAVFICVLFI
jgi:hypothetical protein